MVTSVYSESLIALCAQGAFADITIPTTNTINHLRTDIPQTKIFFSTVPFYVGIMMTVLIHHRSPSFECKLVVAVPTVTTFYFLCFADSLDYPSSETDAMASDTLAQEIQLLRQYLGGRSPVQTSYTPPSSSEPESPLEGAFDRIRRRGGMHRGWKRGPGSCINSCLTGNSMSFIRCKSMCHW